MDTVPNARMYERGVATPQPPKNSTTAIAPCRPCPCKVARVRVRVRVRVVE